MAFQDNRQFIDALEKTGDVVRVKKEVDWELEAGAIIRRLCERSGPAALFEKVKDYPDGYRLLGGPLATFRRLAIAMGIEPDTPFKGIVEEYGRRLEHPIKPKVVATGPCKENIMVGNDVDLFRFPAPLIHGDDGGRYLGTWHVVVTKDPDSDWVNWGMYRLMLYDRQHLAGLLVPFQHGPSIFYQKYKSRGKAMPFAAAIGADPICSLTAASRYGRGESEVDFAGALRREPVELVKCETSDLLVPAHAEIILEGEILPDVMLEEGPFGEYTGYSSLPRSLKPVYHIKAVTYRSNPILPMTCVGFPTTEDHVTLSISYSHFYSKLLKEWGIPISGVFVPPPTVGILAIVGVKPLYPNISSQIAKLMTIGGLPVHVIVVDDETDIYNLTEVLHAFATKCHPVRGIRQFDNDTSTPLLPFWSAQDRAQGKGGRAIYDCTFPAEWPRQMVPRKTTFDKTYPKDIKERVLANWKSYGFE